MRAVVTRVGSATVRVAGAVIAEIGPGLLALVGVTHSDTAQDADALGVKMYNLRIMAGERSAADIGAPVLIVSQFTLYADTRKGRRPSWLAAAPGSLAEPLVAMVVEKLRNLGAEVAVGRFGADMQVESVNDGPVTIIIETPNR